MLYYNGFVTLLPRRGNIITKAWKCYVFDMSLALDRATIESSKTKQNLESSLWRVNYTLMDKYLFTASMRTDGSSSFAEHHKWATFFSGAVA